MRLQHCTDMAIDQEQHILDNNHPAINDEQDLDDLNLLPTVEERKRLLTIEPIVFLLFFAVNLSCESMRVFEPSS